MNRRRIALLIVAALLLVLIPSVFYTVDETQQVIITQFGRPIGDPIATPGLKMKLPFIWDVHYFDKRWLPWDGDPNQITTRDKKFIWVDTYARWRIAEPLTFFESMRDEDGAQSRLDDIIDGETRNVVAGYDLIDIVRSSNREFEVAEGLQAFVTRQTVEEVTDGRDALAQAVLERSSEITPSFGIELVDVKFKAINYVDEVQAQVYERMITERQRIAERSRSEGEGQAAEIRGQKEKELNVIESEAFRKAEEIRGVADAEATSIYAGAYNKDPDFYQFMKTLETYRSSLNEDVTLVLTSDSEFLTFLKQSGR